MTIYVKLEVDEVFKTKDALEDAQAKTKKVEAKGLEFERIRNEKRKNSIGIISRIREIESEIRKIEEMLPKESLETLKTERQIKPKPTNTVIKSQTKKKTKKEFQKEELLRIKKQLEELK